MRNIFKIYTTDMKKLVTNLFALVIVVGICFIPSLYAWFNIYSNWDPYANTANIKIAVTTSDKGYQTEDGTIVNMGQEVIDELKDNHKIGWNVVKTNSQALKGVNSGEYYAAIVISEDFSKSMYNVLEQDFSNPTITYYENEKKNAVATKITDSAVSTLKESINHQFIKVIASTIFEKTSAISKDLEDKNGVGALEDKLNSINSNIKSYSEMIDSFTKSNEALTNAVNQADGKIPSLQSEIADAQSKMAKNSSSITSTRSTLSTFNQNVKDSLSAIQASINKVSKDLQNAGLADKAQTIADGVAKTMDDSGLLTNQIDTLSASLNTLLDQVQTDLQNADTTSMTAEVKAQKEQLKQNLLDSIGTLKTIQTGVTDVQSQLKTVKSQVNGSASNAARTYTQNSVNSVVGVMESCVSSISDIQTLYSGNLVPQMDNVLSGLTQVMDNVSSLLDSLNATVSNVNTVMDGAVTTVNDADKSFADIQTVLNSVSSKLDRIIVKLQDMNKDKRVTTLQKMMQGDPSEYGDFFAEPVTVTTEQIYPVKNYGSSVAPFYTILAIWVGALLLVAILKVHADPRIYPESTQIQRFFGRFLLFFTLSQIQAAVIVLGNIFLLHCQVLYPGLFWLGVSLSGMVFTLLIYALTLSFGNMGKAIAVVIMVIQIAGSGGTYPIEILPEFYQKVYLFFPFPYAITSLREAVAGMYGSTYVKSLLQLMLFAVAALLIGLVIRKPFEGVNRFMDKRMKDTKMM